MPKMKNAGGRSEMSIESMLKKTCYVNWARTYQRRGVTGRYICIAWTGPGWDLSWHPLQVMPGSIEVEERHGRQASKIRRNQIVYSLKLGLKV